MARENWFYTRVSVGKIDVYSSFLSNKMESIPFYLIFSDVWDDLSQSDKSDLAKAAAYDEDGTWADDLRRLHTSVKSRTACEIPVRFSMRLVNALTNRVDKQGKVFIVPNSERITHIYVRNVSLPLIAPTYGMDSIALANIINKLYGYPHVQTRVYCTSGNKFDFDYMALTATAFLLLDNPRIEDLDAVEENYMKHKVNKPFLVGLVQTRSRKLFEEFIINLANNNFSIHPNIKNVAIGKYYYAFVAVDTV